MMADILHFVIDLTRHLEDEESPLVILLFGPGFRSAFVCQSRESDVCVCVTGIR